MHGFRQGGASLLGASGDGLAVIVARRRADMHPLAVGSVDAEDLDGLLAGRAELVWESGIELRDLSGRHRDVVLAQDQAHLP